MKQEDIKEQKTISEKIDAFFTKNRKIALIALACVGLIIAAVVISVIIVDSSNKKAIAQVESIIYDFETFKSEKLTNALDSLTDEEKRLLSEEAQSVIEKLSPFQSKNNYAGFMANQQIGDIYFGNGDFEKALEAYEKVSFSENTYIAGVVSFNAASCADELSQFEKAYTYYTKASTCKNFPFKERALFNAARVQESIDKTKALSVYDMLVRDYPDSEWGLLAKTRIIELGL
ncbi:MAG: tetratricopeptide repeat protein [Spirochaetaceae bacterium]|nr:tetratricopeptide repeat protein [Spirochaetaceae bacterium]